MKLTAVIICRSRREKGFKRALKSVEFVDEILVEERRETGDFAAARNEALKKAKGEWVVFVDSDEEIGEELKKEIRRITDKGYKDYEFRTWLSRWRKFARSPSPARPDVRRDSGQALRYARGGLRRQQSHSQICQLRQFFKCETREDYKNYNIGGAYIRRRDRFLGKWLKFGETASVRLLRLGRREAGRWERPVHEVWKIGGRIVELKNPIWHYSHESVDGMVEKSDRYSGIEAEYRFGSGAPAVRSPLPWLTATRRGVATAGFGRASGFLQGKNPGPSEKFGEMWIAGEMILYPIGKFIQNYFWRLGMLDGMEGLIHALMMSWHSFLVRAKLVHKNLKYQIL